MKKLFILILVLLPFCLFAQTESAPMLLGRISKDDLTKAPYNKWFDKEYNNYEVNRNVVEQLKRLNLKDYTITIFMGTWCGDTHRELPRFIKVLEQADVPSTKVEIVALNWGDGVHKQSPTGEERDKYIFKVPTFIISKNGKEINRIIEYPVESLERDLLSIVSGEKSSELAYSPNCHSYPYLIKWIKGGTLTDKNVSVRSLADKIRHITKNASEIMAVGYVLCERGEKHQAATLAKIAALLFPETISYSSCAYMLSQNKEYEEALKMAKKYLVRNTSEKDVDKILELYDEIKTNLK